MKITMVGHTIPGSGVMGVSIGINKYIFNLASELKTMRHDVELLIRNDFIPKQKWINPIYSPKKTWIVYPHFVGKQIKNKHADVFHSDYVTTGSALIKHNKKPSVVAIHGLEPFEYDLSKMKASDRLRYRWYMRCFEKIKKADAILVMSEFVKKQALKYTNIPDEKIHVTYNGLDNKEFFPLKKKENKKLRIGYMGGLDGRKNVKLLVDVFSELSKRDDIELHVGGGGSSLTEFKKKNIRNATFYGRIPDEKANEFLNSLDIFVFPSLDEGFGMPPLEAMACGVPVVSSNKASMPEVVGNAGILTDPNKSDLKNAILTLAESKQKRKQYSKLGIENSKKFTWIKCAEKTLKIYEEVK